MTRGPATLSFPRCSRCKTRRKDVRLRSSVSRSRYYCDGCYEELEAYRASRGTGGFSQRVRGRVGT